ncbi:hypothetical protein H633G_07279 [Metarhizium anisopliae BRIP 53284]|nr:hypothetical protein H633G_07279 [Metarhizium anisopliae BRIP 53284]
MARRAEAAQTRAIVYAGQTEQVTSFSESLDIPALEIELERAIWQVEQALQKADEQQQQQQTQKHGDGTNANHDVKSKDSKEKQ